jgi:hypothetical protein
MSHRRLQPDSWKQALQFINKCPACSAAYDVERAELFAKYDQACLVHQTCPTCRSYFIAMIVSVGHGLSSVGMVTDLNLEDAKRLHGSEPINLDEALEAYEVLQSKKFAASLL